MTMENWQHEQPLSELLRPSCLEDLTLVDKDITRLQKMIDTKSVSNMIFYGPPGLGKTSAARIITTAVDAEVMSFDGSDQDSAGSLQKYVPQFVRTVSLFGQKKIVLIDEGEFMTRKDQVMLRSVIEDTYDICRFIITTNNIARIDRAVQSRMVAINFDVHSAMTKSVVARMVERFGSKLNSKSIRYDEEELKRIVMLYYPDFRQTINNIEFQFS